jgi:DMSO/TMAO reductase YedYZ molybdopterin-dependent catalytic subunit
MSHDPPRVDNEPAWVHSHSHDPNPTPPLGDGAIVFIANEQTQRLTVEFLQSLPATHVADCFIVSTGHGTSGPFTFGGVTVSDLLARLLPAGFVWRHVDVVSDDAFGTRLTPTAVFEPSPGGPVLLAYAVNGAPLTRAAGLVRLIVPAETDDALKQVKWVARIEVE